MIAIVSALQTYILKKTQINLNSQARDLPNTRPKKIPKPESDKTTKEESAKQNVLFMQQAPKTVAKEILVVFTVFFLA